MTWGGQAREKPQLDTGMKNKTPALNPRGRAGKSKRHRPSNIKHGRLLRLFQGGLKPRSAFGRMAAKYNGLN